MPYIVDGNNLLGRLAGGPGRQPPGVLVSILADRLRGNSASITLVFDGSPVSGPSRLTLGRLRVIYSSPASADDTIVALVGRAARAREWTVVTADRGLAARVRDVGAHVMGLQEFEQRFVSESRDEPRTSRSPSVEDWAAYFSDESNRNLR